MTSVLTTAYKCTVQDRKFLRHIAKDLAKGETVYPSMLQKYNDMQTALPRTKNPLINAINWCRAFMENMSQVGIGSMRKNNILR